MSRMIAWVGMVLWGILTVPIQTNAADTLAIPIKIQAQETQKGSSTENTLQLENLKLRDSIASLKANNSPMGIKTPERFIWASGIAFAFLLLWILLVIYYYYWAIRRYAMNYGLSDEEWKVLHPALYADKNEMALYEKKKADMILANTANTTAATATPISGKPESPDKVATPDGQSNQPFEEPKENPYKNDSFGLPPGTLRGTLALTAMVCVILIESVNLFSPVNLENHFADLLIVFKMVIGFYFGTKALEILESKRAEVKIHEATMGANITNPGALAPMAPTPSAPTSEVHLESSSNENPPQATPGATPAHSSIQKTIFDQAKKYLPDSVTKPLAKLLELPSEKPAVIEGLTAIRVPNIIANAPMPPPEAPPSPDAPKVKTSTTAATLTEATPLKIKVLALTAGFETGLGFPDCFGAVAGNFDGQGISYGALQWNFGQGTLQPLLQKILRNHENVMKDIFSKDLFTELNQILALPKEEQLAWINKYQITKQNPTTGVRRLVLDPRLAEPFRILGKTKEMIEIQADEAGTRYMKALANCEQYGLNTQRGVALMFDINVQNGLVDKNGAGARIRQDYEGLNQNLPANEIQEARMKIIAQRRSEVVNAEWRADVLSRKMTIATGHGEVHKRKYNLDDFKIGLTPYVA